MKNTKVTKKLVVCGLALVSIGATANFTSNNASNQVHAMSQEQAQKYNYQLMTDGHFAGFYLPEGSQEYAGLKALDVTVKFVDSKTGAVVGSQFVNKQTGSTGVIFRLSNAGVDTNVYGVAPTTKYANLGYEITKDGQQTGFYESVRIGSSDFKSDDGKGNLTLTIPVVKYGTSSNNTSNNNTTPAQPSTPTPTQPTTKNVATVNYVSGYGIATWGNVQSNPQVTGHYLPTGSQWIVNTTVKGTDGRSWYLVGNNEWASEQYYDLQDENSSQDLNGVLRVNYVPGYSINIWSNASSNSHAAGKVQHGSEYSVHSRKVVNGKTWYNIGANQWIQGDYAVLRSEQSRGNKVFQ